jgi:hypothetical protein
MTINEFIEAGQIATQHCAKSSARSSGEYYYVGQEYQEWLDSTSRFLRLSFPADSDTTRFENLAHKANGNGDEYFHKLIGILRAFEKYPPVEQKLSILPIVDQMCRNFDRFSVQIKRRHGGDRPTIIMNDEYDVQDAMHALLKLHVNDVRPEDYVPSYAGRNSRVDFLLPEYDIILETKMTRTTLKDKEVGDELTVDIAHYKGHGVGNHLVCFIYDKESFLCNPHGLIRDLEKQSSPEFKVSVIISPM